MSYTNSLNIITTAGKISADFPPEFLIGKQFEKSLIFRILRNFLGFLLVGLTPGQSKSFELEEVQEL